MYPNSRKRRKQNGLVPLTLGETQTVPQSIPEAAAFGLCSFPPSLLSLSLTQTLLQAKHQELCFLGNLCGEREFKMMGNMHSDQVHIYAPPCSLGFICNTGQGPKMLQVAIHLKLNEKWSLPLSLALLLKSLGDYDFLLAISGPPFPIPIKWLWSFTSFAILYSKCTQCANGPHGLMEQIVA